MTIESINVLLISIFILHSLILTFLSKEDPEKGSLLVCINSFYEKSDIGPFQTNNEPQFLL